MMLGGDVGRATAASERVAGSEAAARCSTGLGGGWRQRWIAAATGWKRGVLERSGRGRGVVKRSAAK